MNYRVERTDDADRDLVASFDFLIESYAAFGEDLGDAIERAAKRLRRIHAAMEALGRAPHQGTLRPNLSPGLRSATKERAVFYFDVDDDRQIVRVLAIFFGGQDHQRLMLMRVRGKAGRG